MLAIRVYGSYHAKFVIHDIMAWRRALKPYLYLALTIP